MRSRQRPIQKADAYERARWYISRHWPVVAVAAIVQVAPNTVRAWRRQMGRDAIRRKIERIAARAT